MKNAIIKARTPLPMIIVGVFVVAMGVFLFTPTPADAGPNPGAIWTTTDSCGDPQNVNHYSVGDWVYINGSGFSRGSHDWKIKGLPGQASGDPGTVVASGLLWVKKDGTFCKKAYKINSNDWGEYKAQVRWSKNNWKSDNYKVKRTAIVNAHKIICENESDLPNWGDHEVTKITPALLNIFIADSNGNCKYADNWNFQWKLGSGDWNNFSNTSPATISTFKKTAQFWFQEVWNNDYIPFSNDITPSNGYDDVSAEFYCNNDIRHYDNYEWINMQNGEEYHCVGFNAPATSSISGYKWHDLNADGFWDDGEPKLDGLEIYIDENLNSQHDGEEPLVVTGDGDWPDGYYKFGDLTPGTYQVCEVWDIWGNSWIPSYPSSYPCCHQITVNPGENSTDNNFGNYKMSKLSGWKWNDLNRDGVWQKEGDNPEPAIKIGNLRIRLWTKNEAGDFVSSGNASLYSNGYFGWSSLAPNTYWLSEYNVPDGWVQTNLGEDAPVTHWGDRLLGPIVVTSDTVNPDNNFGNYEITTGSLTVCKYNDLDGNETGDEPMHWNITIVDQDGDDAGETWYTATDGETGCITLEGMDFGSYLISEEQVAGWEQTYPHHDGTWGDQWLDINLETPNPQTEFYNHLIPTYSLHGFKWNDINGNGEWDCQDWGGNHQHTIGWGTPQCEPKLADWTIFIDENANGILDEGEQFTTTDDEGGDYKFESLVAGTYFVCEVQQDGWVQAYPENCHEVILPAPHIVSATFEETPVPDQMFNFGNYHAYCGNLIVDEGEECDGNVEGYGQYCSETCTIEELYTLNKTDNKDTAEPGKLSTYEITFGYTMEEVEPLTTGYIVDTIPDNFTVDEGIISDSGVYDDTTRTITWEIGELIETHTFTLSGLIDAEMPEGTTILLNTAKLYQQPMLVTAVMAQEIIVDEIVEPEPILLLTATDETTVNPNPVDMSIAKSVDKAMASHGDLVTYEITATNAKDTETCDGVTLTITDDITDVLVDASLVSTDSTNQDGNVLTWVFEGVACGETVTGEVVVEVLADSYHGAVIENIAWVRDSNDNSVTSQMVDTQISAPTVILDLSKTVNKLLANPTDVLTYTVVLNNSGNVAATNLTLNDVLPAGLTFANEDGSNSGDTEKTWTWDSLGVGQDVTVKYDVLVDSKAADDTYINTATASADNHDKVSDTATTEIVTPKVEGAEAPSLSIVKTVSEETANPNQTVNYSVTITNDGSAVAYNAVLTDVLPQGLVYAGTVTQTEASWKLGDIVPTESITVEYQATVLSNALASTYVNTATVTADDTPKVSDTADLDVVLIKVLGAEIDEDAALPVTGPQAQHYLYFILAGILIAGSLFALKLTSSKEKS